MIRGELMKMNEYIDHTLLKPEATLEQVIRLCSEAVKHSFKAVCVNPVFAGSAAKELHGSGVLPCVVIGFPLGASAARVKSFEAERAVEDGAREIDMVINIGGLKSGRAGDVERDIRGVVEAVGGRALVKVIIECCLLTDDEKRTACGCILNAGADFVKTSTGFSTGGATAADVALLRKAVGDGAGVKASGGVKDYRTALAMIEAGATRIGTSSGIAIMEEAKQKDGC